MPTRTLTVVFTDIKGFTARTSKTSRASMLELLQKHEELLAPIVASHGGRVIKTIGDAFLLVFESPTNAVLCGLRMQARLRSYNRDATEEQRIEIRVAINTGELELVNNDVFGESVNLASRIEGITDAGEVFFSEATYLAMNKSEVPTSQVGEFRLKGIAEQVQIFRVVQDEDLDLYKKVLASEPPPGARAGGSSVDEGALSESLVLASEQLQQIVPGRRTDPLLWAAATVAMLVLLAVGVLVVRGAQFRGNVARIDELVAASEWGQAFELTDALQQQRPAATELIAKLESVATAELQALLAAQRFARAAERLQSLAEAHPNLGALDALDRQLRLEHATALYQSPARADVEQARDMLEELAEAYPRDLEVRYRLAQELAFNGVQRDPIRALGLVREIVTAEPTTFAADVQVERIVLESLGHADLGRQYPELLEFVLGSFATASVRASAESIDAADDELRRNAYAILARSGELTAAREFRFYWTELQARDLGTFTATRDQTLGYFEALMPDGIPPELMALIPAGAVLPPTLRNRRDAGDRAQQIVADLLREPLRAQLAAAANDGSGNTLSVRAAAILAGQ